MSGASSSSLGGRENVHVLMKPRLSDAGATPSAAQQLPLVGGLVDGSLVSPLG